MNKVLIIIFILAAALLGYLLLRQEPQNEDTYMYIDTAPMDTYEPPPAPYEDKIKEAESESFRPAMPIPPDSKASE